MFKKYLVLLLIVLMFNLVNARLSFAQTQDSLTQEVKTKVAKIGTGEKAKVKIELRNETKIKGFVSAIESDSFTVTDKKTGSTTKIEYSQVKKVSRDRMSTGAIIAIAGGAAAATVLLLIYRAIYCNEQAC